MTLRPADECAIHGIYGYENMRGRLVGLAGLDGGEYWWVRVGGVTRVIPDAHLTLLDDAWDGFLMAP